jgi:hypothetical protein
MSMSLHENTIFGMQGEVHRPRFLLKYVLEANIFRFDLRTPGVGWFSLAVMKVVISPLNSVGQ